MDPSGSQKRTLRSSIGSSYSEGRKSTGAVTDLTYTDGDGDEYRPDNPTKRKDRELYIEPQYVAQPKTNDELFKFPVGDKFAISVREHDLHRLHPGEFLNDTVIEFYIKYLQIEYSLKKVKIFNSYFYNNLTSKPENGTKKDGNYAQVKSSTKNEDIFENDFIVIPINEHLHWFLAIIYNPSGIFKPVAASERETIIVDDSDTEDTSSIMQGLQDGDVDELTQPQVIQSSQDVELVHVREVQTPSRTGSNKKSKMNLKPKENEEQKNLDKFKNKCNLFVMDSLGIERKAIGHLKRYLTLEAARRHPGREVFDQKNIVSGTHTKVPLQPNHCDCGVYVLEYLECLFKDTPKYLDYMLRRKADRVAWFQEGDILQKRVQIRSLMESLTEEYQKVRKDEVFEDTDDEVVILVKKSI